VEVELNPLVATTTGVVAVDARATLARPAGASALGATVRASDADG
jgi:hypothetical protein